MIFSIIVPIYKVEEYLSSCIESILNQSFQDYEIILIDDGSPDLCPAICDEYARKDSRIRVIHQKNQGVSAARNRGIQEAKGEYILFLDSDDKLVDGCLEKSNNIIIKNAEADIIFCNYYLKDDERVIERNYSRFKDLINNSNIDIVINEMISSNYLNSVWSKIYKRDYVLNEQTRFDERLMFAEDFLFVLNLLVKKPKCKYADLFLIEYYVREASITRSINYNKELSKVDFCNKSLDILKEYNIEIGYNIIVSLNTTYLSILNDYYRYNKNERAKVKEIFDKRHFLLIKDKSNNNRILFASINILGLYITSLLKNIRIKFKAIL